MEEITEATEADIRNIGEETLRKLKETGGIGFVLAGRPYHLDPEINHGIPELINSLGISVLTEDSISHLDEENLDLRVVNQWVYHSRLYKAANVCRKNDNLEMVQLNFLVSGRQSTCRRHLSLEIGRASCRERVSSPV